MTYRRLSQPFVFCLALLLTLPAACLGGFGGLGAFEPIDEDFERPSPILNAEGALRRQCQPDKLDGPSQVFEHALCLCGDLDDVGSGVVTRSSSHLAGNDPGLGHVGVNGRVDLVGNFAVDGSFNAAGGIDGVGDLDVGRELITGNDVDVVGNWTVGQDAWIDGDLDVVGDMDINGDLFLSGSLSAVGDVNFVDGRRGFDYRGAPCPCGRNQIIDVAAEVAKRRDLNNNDRLGSGDELILDDGEYYFARPQDVLGKREIRVVGRASIFVEGDIETVGEMNLVVEEGAEAELWVSGTIKTVGNLELGAPSKSRARAFKLFMGGRGEALVNVGNAQFVGGIYAPEADIDFVGDLEVRGSLFANNLKGTGSLDIEYDSDLSAPPECVEEFFQTTD